MKFAHLSDVHLGSWSTHPDMRDLPAKAFEAAIEICIAERVDFILIAGDLFDTSIPPIETLRECATLRRRCRDVNIRVYIVPGSHDYSPTGKTMLSVLERAGLLVDVAKIEHMNEGTDQERIMLRFTLDSSGAKICGILGRAGALERSYYEKLDRSVESEPGFKIFVMHSAIAEYAPVNVAGTAVPLALLPKNFHYYANGHVHLRLLEKTSGGYVAFPGPLFPTSFDELEHYDSGFYIAEQRDNELQVRRVPVKLFDVFSIDIVRDRTTPERLEHDVRTALEENDIAGKVVLVRLAATLETGKPGNVDFQRLAAVAAERGARCLKKNIAKLVTMEFEDATGSSQQFIEDMERAIVEKTPAFPHFADSAQTIRELMHALATERQEGESVGTFETRLKEGAK